MRKQSRGLALAFLFPVGVWGVMHAQEPAPPASRPAGTEAKPDAPKAERVEPKPISASVKKGLDWLVEHQLKDGAWGQGDESAQMGGGAGLRDTPNVADTCVAALALIRSGSTPESGPYKDSIARAVRYVRSQVEESDSQSLDVSKVKGTRVQGKLGPNIDTFMASLLLAEVEGKMGEPAANKSVDLALHKVIDKIKKHQKADGTWDNATGWAPILAQSMAGKGLNRAVQNGAIVSEEVLAKTESYAKLQLAQASPVATAAPAGIPAEPTAGVAIAAAPAVGPVVAYSADGSKLAPATGDLRVFSRASRSGRGVGGGFGSAGVELYDRAASLSVLNDSVNTNATKEAELNQVIETSRDEKQVAEARATLGRYKATSLACAEAREQVVARLADPRFIAGFGSNGGEEFLSYMNIGDSLVQQGGADWKKWDESMTANLNRIQNDDGSWTGHHCITGRTFCTSTALLVLLGDRAAAPTIKNPATTRVEPK